MRILYTINAPGAIQKILDCLSLPSKPLPISPAENAGIRPVLSKLA
jgi:hypothetical protein